MHSDPARRGMGVLCIAVFEFDCLTEPDFTFELGRPQVRTEFELVDQVNAEIAMHGLSRGCTGIALRRPSSCFDDPVPEFG
jgi:hypothetical protein